MNSSDMIKAMEYSAAAYRDVQPYTSHGCQAVNVYGRADVHYFLCREGDTLWITFRGTDSWNDWKADLTFWKKTVPYNNTSSKIRVHTGFINLYKLSGVRDRILSKITPEIRAVKITGHSLGAALAVLCAVDIEYNYPDRDIEAIVFGCPRVGNKAFMKSYNKRVSKTVRIENSNDVITKVPPALWGFRHVGAKLHVGSPRLPLIARALDHYPHRYYAGLIKRIYFH
ncbi:MAG: lipase family protein [Oscillospiraceae bacterium]|nr:lipase family protein [Oscillospiraceae bacterium]